VDPVGAAKPHMQRDLDELDKKILAIYQADTRLAAHEIGEAMGLSVAAVQRRLKRMRETGVIVAELAQVAPETVGYPLTCLVGVDLERETLADLERFQQRMRAYPRVQQCYYVTGQQDFMLVVLSRDMADYDAFTREALLGDGNVKSFTTFVVLDRVKVGLGVPID
jgi:Lrp/AsnC family transcriptional regulator, leucine-responsive regulatory protein